MMKPHKLKVVWICGFTNASIQEKLKPWRKIGEIAPWITNIIPLFESDPDIELHIISTHLWIPYTKSFKHNGIHYHFVCQGIPLIGKSWPSFFPLDIWSDYALIKRSIKAVVDKIRPDIIHIYGAENTYHAASILQFKCKYPILVTLQGFLHKISPNTRNPRVRRRIERELLIYKNLKHFGYRTQIMGKVLKDLNPTAELHYHGFVQKIPLYRNPGEDKKYDIVYFARITKSKGIEDLIKAMAILKVKKQDVSLLVIGNSSTEYLKSLKKTAKELGIYENIEWAGFMQTQQEVYKLASEAKISVLPSHYDMIPGTIIESMFLMLPVVAYNIGSIPEVNLKSNVICLVEINDIEGLAKAMYELIIDTSLRINRAQHGYARAVEMFDNSKIVSDIKQAYREVILDFNVV